MREFIIGDKLLLASWNRSIFYKIYIPTGYYFKNGKRKFNTYPFGTQGYLLKVKRVL